MKITYLILLISIITACGGSDKTQFEFAGGSLKSSLENAPFTYISFETEDYNAHRVLSQVLEGLVSINVETNKIEGQIASDWKISDDGLTYSFSLRDDVYFHPHELLTSKSERLLNVEDVVATFEKICTPNSDGKPTRAYELIYKGNLKGAEEFYSKKAKKISGIKAEEGKITLTLTKRDDNFLYKLAHIQSSILPLEILEADAMSDMIGTGPFMFASETTSEPQRIILIKNSDYYELSPEGYALPYLDSLEFIVQNRKLEQLDMFENRQIDMILGLPTSRITKMLEGRIEDFNSTPPKLLLHKNPALATNYYFFNMTDPRFQDPRVRQAFNYAINKDRIGREVLRNQYEELGLYGVVPPINKDFRGYNFKSVKEHGYAYNPEKARKLLAEAGYPKGEGFGSVTLRFNIGDINSAVADEFAQQIFQVLGINVNIDGSTFEQLNEDATMGEGDIFRTAWAADYPNPETFLNQFYGKHLDQTGKVNSPINQAKYSNPKFDMFFEQAKQSDNLIDKMNLYSKSEIELLKNPPIIPLWYNGDMQIIYSDIRNLHFNSLGLFDFKTVYIKEWTAEEYQKSQVK